MKTKISLIIAVVMVFALAGLTRADIIELDLFTLGCPSTHDHNTPAWSSNFDLGVEFTQIDHVYMDWSGAITAGMAIEYSDPDNPFPLDVAIKAYLDMPVDAGTSVWGGEASYPEPEPFDYQSDFELFGLGSWSDLVGGQGTIWIYYAELTSVIGTYVESGSVVLDRVNFVVEGVVIPEPSTLCLLSLGGFWITRGALRKRSN